MIYRIFINSRIFPAALFAVGLLIFSACVNNSPKENLFCSFEIKDFQPVANWSDTSGTGSLKTIELDYRNAVEGFVIPSVLQLADGFVYRFYIKNNSGVPQRYRYKLYYQNESYKFPECSAEDSSEMGEFAGENFYGSWENSSEGFRITSEIPSDGTFHEISGSFRITGNPRNEKKYFNAGRNERWKRNPRTGRYSFFLAVLTDSLYNTKFLPEYVKDISKIDKRGFVNPYYWFFYSGQANTRNLLAVASSDTLRVIAQLPLETGIYIDTADFSYCPYRLPFTSYCGNSAYLYRNAAIKQFVHYVHESSVLLNIPVIRDVAGGDYTLKDYYWNMAFQAPDERVTIKPETGKCPCEQLETDAENKIITMANPAAVPGNLIKQNVGVITRHGFTYGKFTVKVKLTELLNKHGIWNGITNAVWLITQSEDPWNSRRACRKKGYIADYYNDPKNSRSPYTSYSEIDFEILKTVPYCPEYVYPPAYLTPVADRKNERAWNLPYPGEDEKSKDEIMVCCTNWDMACPQPENFEVGCHEVYYGKQKFYAHRWDHWYKAVTEKTPASDDELFGGDYYYFQIEWKPEEIIWRIGPEKDKMRVVGYMNAAMTSIPNNQMLLIISQEFHNTLWWPGSPFEQENIPFPGRELKGKILEITIE